MLCAYYDKSCDSSALFENFEIAKDSSFHEHLNRYPVIYIDITDFTTRYKGQEDIAGDLQNEVMTDVHKAYPEIEIPSGSDLMTYLLEVIAVTNDKFIMIIDEWDAMCRELSHSPELMDRYVNLLRRLFKGGSTAKVFAGVYMTGILPIKKYGTQSALNDFREVPECFLYHEISSSEAAHQVNPLKH